MMAFALVGVATAVVLGSAGVLDAETSTITLVNRNQGFTDGHPGSLRRIARPSSWSPS